MLNNIKKIFTFESEEDRLAKQWENLVEEFMPSQGKKLLECTKNTVNYFLEDSETFSLNYSPKRKAELSEQIESKVTHSSESREKYREFADDIRKKYNLPKQEAKKQNRNCCSIS